MTLKSVNLQFDRFFSSVVKENCAFARDGSLFWGSYCGAKQCCCDGEIPSNKRAKLHTVAASNNRDHTPRSLYYCLFASRIYGCPFFAHIPFVAYATQVAYGITEAVNRIIITAAASKGKNRGPLRTLVQRSSFPTLGSNPDNCIET